MALHAQIHNRLRYEKRNEKVTLVWRQPHRTRCMINAKRLSCRVSTWPSLERWDGIPQAFDNAVIQSNEEVDGTA